MSDEWSWPYTDNYTGPFWSDGKWQASVARGAKKPKNRLDSYSRDHDTAYALCNDLDCLDRADDLYFTRTRDMAFVPRIIGAIPKYGNAPFRILNRSFDKLLGWRKIFMGNLASMEDERQAKIAKREWERDRAIDAANRERLRKEVPQTGTNTNSGLPEDVSYAPVYNGMTFNQPKEMEPTVPGIDDTNVYLPGGEVGTPGQGTTSGDTSTYLPAGAIDANADQGGNAAGTDRLNYLWASSRFRPRKRRRSRKFR